MSLIAYLNGTDTLSQGLGISGTIGLWKSVAASTRGAMPIPGRVRSRLSSIDQVSTKPFALPLNVLATTVTARNATLDWLATIHRQRITVRMSDGVNVRELRGVVTNIDMTPKVLANSVHCDGILTMLSDDPTWAEITAIQLLLTTVRLAVPMGTAPVEDWLIELMNSAGTVTNPSVIIRKGSGDILFTLLFTGSNTATQHLTADADAGSAAQESGGATTSVISGWSGGFPPLTLTDQMTIELAASSGTPTGLLRYVQRSWS